MIKTSNDADMKTAVFIGLLLLLHHGNEALQLKEDCKWNYTLKNEDQQCVFTVQMKDLGAAHPTQCKGLYEDVPTYTMEDGRNVISVRLERTSDPKLQDIKVSWKSVKGVLRYLLVLELKKPHDGYTINTENTRCISVDMIPRDNGIQFQEFYDLVFDCIQVPTGTMKAVLQTTIRVPSNEKKKCKRKTCFDFADPVFMAHNINASCCRRRVYSDDVKLLEHDSCKWLISAKKESFSSWTYEVKEQNSRNLVHEGKLIPVNRLPTDRVVASVIYFEGPAIYSLKVSFWCSFDPADEMAADHVCSTITKQIDARLCGVNNAENHTEKLVADEESSGTLLPLVVILASIAVALMGVTVVVVEVRKRSCLCFKSHQNNMNINGVNGALIKTTPEKICQMKTENSATKELLETLPT